MMRSALPLYIVLSLWAFLTTALPSGDTQDPTVAVKQVLGEVENSGLLDPEKASQVLAEHPDLLQMFNVEGEGTKTNALSIRADNPDPGLAQNLWVTVPATCVHQTPLDSEPHVTNLPQYACILACLATETGAHYTAGTMVHTVALWRTIGV